MRFSSPGLWKCLNSSWSSALIVSMVKLKISSPVAFRLLVHRPAMPMGCPSLRWMRVGTAEPPRQSGS
ncbi:hypothetical protein D9M68_986820 [compost metagenome]